MGMPLTSRVGWTADMARALPDDGNRQPVATIPPFSLDVVAYFDEVLGKRRDWTLFTLIGCTRSIAWSTHPSPDPCA